MEMIAHNAEILQTKWIFASRFLQHTKKKLFHATVIEYHLASIGSGAHMIVSARHYHSIPTHTAITSPEAWPLEAHSQILAENLCPLKWYVHNSNHLSISYAHFHSIVTG
jgi:hypothetical protein